jgi:hypothetical protein
MPVEAKARSYRTFGSRSPCLPDDPGRAADICNRLIVSAGRKRKGFGVESDGSAYEW